MATSKIVSPVRRWRASLPMMEPRGPLDRLLGRRHGPRLAAPMRLRFRNGRMGMPLSLRTLAALGAGAIASAVLLPRALGNGARRTMERPWGPSRTLSVAEVMTRDVVTAEPSTTVRELARLMESRNVGTVVIMAEGQVRGLVTDRHLVTRCLARGLDPEMCRADEIMTGGGVGPGGLVTANPRMDLLEAARMMGRHRIRRVPVVDNGALVGILSVADLAEEVKSLVSAVMDELSKAEK